MDTGAEANLIRSGIFPNSSFYPAETSLNLVVANGLTLAGGKTCIDTELFFFPNRTGDESSELVCIPANFYEADIQVDAILSFPWMSENKVGIFPHKQALALLEPNSVLLFGESAYVPPKSQKIPKQKRPRKVYQTSILDDDFQKVVLEVRKMNLEVPTHEHMLKNKRLSEAEIHRVARNLVGAPTSCHLIEAREKSMDPERERRIAEYVRKIHEDYDGKVLVHEVPPDPPVRGVYGEAFIKLKEGATPQRQKPFFLHGERKEAMQKITEDWESRKYIERTTAPVEWLCQAFPVPKKSATFPWRGW